MLLLCSVTDAQSSRYTSEVLKSLKVHGHPRPHTRTESSFQYLYSINASLVCKQRRRRAMRPALRQTVTLAIPAQTRARAVWRTRRPSSLPVLVEVRTVVAYSAPASASTIGHIYRGKHTQFTLQNLYTCSPTVSSLLSLRLSGAALSV